MALLFTVVCLAAPPPLLVPNLNADQIESVGSNNYSTFEIACVQEHAYAYIGNVAIVLLTADINKPIYSCGSFNQLNYWKANKQNSNFGYQFGAEY